MADADDDDDREEDREEFARRFTRGSPPGQPDTSSGPRFDGVSVPGHALGPGSNWRSVGPLNLAGRIRALAVDPIDPGGGAPRVVYTGAASGGVFRTLDGGRTWESVWSVDQPSFAIGAISIGADAAGRRVIWVATGEKDHVVGSGVWRAELAPGVQGPVVFARAGSAAQMLPDPGGDLPTSIEAAATDPDDPDHCWFVGPKGVFIIRAGAWIDVDTTVTGVGGRTGRRYADVKFVRTQVARYVVLARAGTAFGDLVLIANPDDAAAGLQAVLDGAVVGPAPGFAIGPLLAVPTMPAAAPAAAPTQNRRNARIAIVPAAAAGGTDRVFAIYTTGTDKVNEQPFETLRHAAAIDLDPVGGALRWASVRNWTLREPGNVGDNQGDYTLCLAASPTNGDHVVFGMLNVWFSHDGGVTWQPALDWNRYDTGDWGQHADQHAAVFVPQAAGLPALWIGNDGGVAVTTRYIDPATGAPPTSEARFGWRRRIHGLVISQAYDLGQSPLLPDVQAVALQDIGGWLTAGSTSWYHVQGGDGVGVAFHATDPYHLIAGWQGTDNTLLGCDDVRFQGDLGIRRENRTFFAPATPPAPPPPAPPPPRFVLARFRGIAPHRVLASGLVADERATVDETLAHPTHPDRLMTVRKRRAYYSENGESWRVARAGTRLELFAHVSHEGNAASTLGGVTVEVGGSAAIPLGFEPGVTSDLRAFSGASPAPIPGRRPPLEIYRARVVAGGGPPYQLTAGDHLTITVEISVGSQAAPNTYQALVDVEFPITREYTVGQILERVQAAMPTARAAVWSRTWAPAAAAVHLPDDVEVELHALPTFHPWPNTLVVVTEARGAAADVFVDGTAIPSLRAQQRLYRGEAGRPAVVVLHAQASYVLPGVEAAVAGLVIGDSISLSTDNAAVHARTMHYNYAAVASWDLNAPPLALRLEGTRRNLPVAARPEIRIWATQARKSLRLWSGRTRGGAYQTFAFPNDPISTARAGIADGNPAVLAAAPAMVADLIPKRWGRYDLSPNGVAGPSSVLRIRIGAVDHDITFTAADYGNSLTDVTVEEARREIEAALAGTDLFCDVQHDHDGLGPTEVAYSPVDEQVMWIGADNGGLFASRDRGASWIDHTRYTDEDFIWQTIEAIAPDREVVGAGVPIGALVGMTRGVYHVTTAGHEARNAGLVRGPDYAEPGIPKVYALERGGGAQEVYAGTDVGVFRSTDDGRQWEPFNQGLPHVQVIDLAYEPTTATLRAATWGRGVFERVLGDRAAPAPLYVRANDRDTGRPSAPHGPALGVDRPAEVGAFESPDVRVTRLPVADLDSVEVDELASEPIIPDQPYTVVVRGHCGGTVEVPSVRLIAAWANASRGLPPIDHSLWDAIAAGPVAAGAFAGWTVIGDAAVGAIASGSAKIATMAKTWTAAELADIGQVAILLIASSANGIVDGKPADAGALATDDPRVALRLVPVQARDVATVTLEALGGATFTGFVATAGADPFAFTPVPGPRVVSGAGPFAVAGVTLDIRFREPVPAPVAAPTTRTITVDFDEGTFSAAPAPAVEVRAFLARLLARETRMVNVVAPAPALAIARSPGDRGPRVGGAAWAAAEIAITAAGVAATDADFAFTALLAPATVAIATPQRFSVRVSNRGAVDAVGATLRLDFLDPRAAAPSLQPITALPKALDPIPAGGSLVVFDEGSIAAVSQAEVLIVATVDHPDDPGPALAVPPATWPEVLELAVRSDNLAMRTVRRA